MLDWVQQLELVMLTVFNIRKAYSLNCEIVQIVFQKQNKSQNSIKTLSRCIDY